MPSSSTPRALSYGSTVEDNDKSNDVAYSAVSILPVSVSLSGVISTDEAMRDVVLSTLEAFGSAALGGSELVGERFDSVDLGSYNEVPVVLAASKKLRSYGGGRRTLEGSATLNVVDASVTLTGAYWEDDPTPGEVSELFVEGVSSEEAREALAAGLRPLVCGSKPICQFGGDSVRVYLADDSAEAGWGSSRADTAAADVVDSLATATPAEDAGRPSGVVSLAGPRDGSKNNAGTVAGAAVGALAALLLAAALFVRARRRRAARREAEETPSLGSLDGLAEPEVTPEEWANRAYDELTARKDDEASKEKKEAEEKEANIATILEGMSDDGQGSVASSQVSGLTGVLSEGDGGDDDNSRPGETLAREDYDIQSRASDCCGYLPRGLTVSSPEPFQAEYQTRSAMAQLNLRKDILHAASDVVGGGSPGGDGGGAGGVSRTMSPRAAAAMEDAQRRRQMGLSARLRGGSRKGGGSGGDGVEGGDASLLDPVDLARSDLV